MTALDEVTRVRIEPAISAAAREVHIGEGRITAIREFRAQHRWIRWLTNLMVVLAVWWVLLVWAISRPLSSLVPADQSDASAFAGVILFLVILPIRKLLDRRKVRSGPVMAALGVCGLTFFIAATRDWWIGGVLDLSAHPGIQAWHPYQGRSVGDMEGGAMLVAMSLILFRLTFLMLLFELGKAALLTAGAAPPSNSASAVLVDSFLEIAWHVDNVARRMRQDSSVVRDGDLDGENINGYGYLSAPERSEILSRLESAAHFVEGYWYKTARLKDHAANIEVRRVADGIAASLRRWKPVAAVGGQEAVDRMREAFVVAVVNAAEGEWGLLASDVSARELLSRRLLKTVRRGLALSVLAGAVILVFVRPFSWTEGLGSAALAAPLMVAAVFLAGFLDPTIYDRMAPVTKLGAELLPKR
ncbi:hypothetical protein ACPCVO_50230 [Streptomyces umbrinus]|uniref:hypothetical protein n=1 Tax=Streptomyces umbrinus TaxID=67370 RepID=UPI003C30A9EF